jgi:hypothetical protein
MRRVGLTLRVRDQNLESGLDRWKQSLYHPVFMTFDDAGAFAPAGG